MADPWQQLTSESAIDRLEGARALEARAPLPTRDLLDLRRIISREPDYLIRRVLSALLAQQALGPTPPVESSLRDERIQPVALQDLRAAAVEEVTQLLLHEMKPLVGRLAADSKVEVPGWEHSRTKRDLDQIRSLLDVIRRYGEAATVPVNVEFDLTDAITEATKEYAKVPSAVLLARTDPLVVVGDWGLLQVAFVNGLKNAGEETEWAEDSITVNWSGTDRDYWITILDTGPGIQTDPELAFAPGVTSKSKATNHGWGLTNARRAVTSAGGTVILAPRGQVGARLEIRWPYPEGYAGP